jgi:BRCA1-associated protein
LIQTRSDQIVELPALSSAVFDSGGGPGRNEVAYQSKIEAISEEFGHLVASQLDSQRAFYEEEMEILRSRLQSTQQETEEQKTIVKKLQAQLQTMEESNQSLEKISKKEKSTMAKKAGKTAQLSQKLENELKEEQIMSAGMRAQIKKLEEEKNEEKKKMEELSKEIVDIKEQLRDSQCGSLLPFMTASVVSKYSSAHVLFLSVMFFIDMQSKIQNNDGGTSELQGGSIVIGKPASSTPKSKGRKG